MLSADRAGAAQVPPDPLLPDFEGRCLTGVVPALLGVVATGRSATAGPEAAPEWLPGPARGARQIVLLVVDGLGAEQLASRTSVAPVLASGSGTVVTSVAPSTTAAALTSLVTGAPPARHGVVGYRVAAHGEVLNVLSWQIGGRDVRREEPARRFQPLPAFPGAGGPVPVVSRAEYEATGFSAVHLGDGVLHGWRTAAGLVVEVRALLEAGSPFVYAYYDGLDRTAHAHGLGAHYEAELRAVDRLVADLVDVLAPGAALVVTADHGHVEVGASAVVLEGDLMASLTLLTGEGRFRWLHAKPGAAADVQAAAAERYGHIAWVRSVDEVIEEGWLGGRPSPEVRARLGDVALVPHAPTAVLDPADTGEQRLVSRHGSLTPAEMLVPLLAWTDR